MTPEHRCFIGAVAGTAIGALTATAILLSRDPGSFGSYLLVFAAVLLLNVVLTGLRSRPLIPLSFTPRQSIFAAAAFLLFATALLEFAMLPEAASDAFVAAGAIVLAYGLFSRPRVSQKVA